MQSKERRRGGVIGRKGGGKMRGSKRRRGAGGRRGEEGRGGEEEGEMGG